MSVLRIQWRWGSVEMVKWLINDQKSLLVEYLRYHLCVLGLNFENKSVSFFYFVPFFLLHMPPLVSQLPEGADDTHIAQCINSTAFGLTAGVFSADHERAKRILRYIWATDDDRVSTIGYRGENILNQSKNDKYFSNGSVCPPMQQNIQKWIEYPTYFPMFQILRGMQVCSQPPFVYI
jgi:hypothetical protein